MAETEFPEVSPNAQEMAPREALLKAVLEFNNSRVKAFFGGEVLEALRLAVGQEATQEEIKKALVAHDASAPSALMQACSIGNYEAVRGNKERTRGCWKAVADPFVCFRKG